MSDPTPQEIAASFNATNVAITVEEGNETQFTFFQSGPTTDYTPNTNGEVDLGGQRLPRSYLYTWVTPFGEESIPSRPSEEVYCRSGETVLVEGLPTSYLPPDGRDRLVRGIRLYRSVATPSGTEYFRLATLWFPNTIVRGEQLNNQVTAEALYPHGLVAGDRISISGGIFNSASGEVLRILDRFRFVYATENSNFISETVTSVQFYYDVSEDPTDGNPFFWGLPNDGLDPFVFRDDFDQLALTTILPSLNYEPPPESLQGLTLLPSNVMAGFVGSNLYLSEPGQFHAWPSENVLSFDYRIVGLAVNAGTLVVLTDGYPYRVDGSTPESMQANKVESMYPCLSKQSIVSTGRGVIYSTHSGLAMYSPSQGADRITRFVLDRQDWKEFIRFDADKVRGFEYEDTYIGSIASGPLPGPQGITGLFSFEQDEQVGGILVMLNYGDTIFQGGWTDPSNGELYISTSSTNIEKFDSGDPLPMFWGSKRFRFPVPTDISAFQIYTEDVFGQSPVDTGSLTLSVSSIFRGDVSAVEYELSGLDLEGVVSRLPLNGKFDEFSFGISNARMTVKSVRFATSPLELKDV